MLAVKGIYDGKKLKLLEEIEIKKTMQVIVTFLEEVQEEPNAMATWITELNAIGKPIDLSNYTPMAKDEIYKNTMAYNHCGESGL